ncbi:MAG: chemotaxis protein CheW [Betaproteobacteria bacterium]
MDHRHAIRDLQNRLAKRLKLLQGQGGTAEWLAVRTGGQHYLFALRQAGEILPAFNLHPVPYTKPWFLGVLTIRGGLYGVIEFSQFVFNGLPRLPVQTDSSMAISINEQLEVNCALQVDEVLGLKGSDAFVASKPPASKAPAYYARRFEDKAGLVWQACDLQILARSPEFLDISIS